MPNIVVVESKDKIQSVSKYLGDGYLVFASLGHVSDLPETGELGVNKKTLEMNYVVTERGERRLNQIRPHLKDANRIILATDPDREGEAIAASLRRELGIGDNYERAKFNEITPEAVREAVNNTVKINDNLVNAQVARRIIDRVVGWEVGPSVTDFAGDDSYPMGRVQSQTVAIIAKRDEIIDNFTPCKHFTIRAHFNGWSAELDTVRSKLGEVMDSERYWTDSQACDALRAKTKDFKVVDFNQKLTESYAKVAFDTSTLHQAAAVRLGFSAKKTDQVANSLYTQGHITYMRTDSTAISNYGYEMIVNYAKANNLKLAEKKRTGSKSPVAQDAHEAIRPTNLDFDGTGLNEEEKALYELIFKRTVASQLSPAIYQKTVIELVCHIDGKDYFYVGGNSILVEPGYLTYFDDTADDQEEEPTQENPIQVFERDETLTAKKTEKVNKTTRPPSRFTEPSLGKYLKAAGIGRPSTYAKIYEKIVEHGYVEKKKNQLISTVKGKFMVKATTGIFSIMEEEFTRNLEKELDDIANGDIDYKQVVFRFFSTLSHEIEKMRLYPPLKPRTECEKCGSVMRRRESKNHPGEFFWKCRNKECGHYAWEIDGKVQTIAEKEAIAAQRKQRQEMIEQFDKMAVNTDGTPKFPCTKCHSAVAKRPYSGIEKEGLYYWRCTNNECQKFYNDNPEENAPYLDEMAYQIKKFTGEDGKPLYPCLDCGSVMLQITPKGKNMFYRCTNQTCNHTFNSDLKGNPTKKAEWLIKAEARSKDKNGKFKWLCKKCKSPVLLRDKREGKGTFKKCSNAECGEYYND